MFFSKVIRKEKGFKPKLEITVGKISSAPFPFTKSYGVTLACSISGTDQDRQNQHEGFMEGDVWVFDLEKLCKRLAEGK